jgi:hypothetical protein
MLFIVTFVLTGGIFCVGRLAAQLNKLLDSGQIGVWHDWRHTAIRREFDSVEDGKLSEVLRPALEGAWS